MTKKILNKIAPGEALTILHQLAKQDKNIKKKIIELAEELMTDIDIEDVCDNVFSAINFIDVHELWDRSGSNSYGEYTSPEEMAFEMVEEALEPFNQEVFRLCDLKMYKEATDYCEGVLLGIYRFEHEGESEFKNWASDVPGECFGYLEEEYKERCKDKKLVKKIEGFIKKECPKWA